MMRAIAKLKANRDRKKKQKAAEVDSAWYYGNGTTIHQTGHLDVETHNGMVVSVWYRCQMLPFNQVEVDKQRSQDMRTVRHLPSITGLNLLDS